MPPRKKTSNALVPVTSEPRSFQIGPRQIVPLQVYWDPEVKPRKSGLWEGEPDKVTWIDPVSELMCIILRSQSGGHLAGYVAVGPYHPLYQFDCDAIPESLEIEVHGGLSYAAKCDDRGFESRSICHGLPEQLHRHLSRAKMEHDLWWFGFQCNRSYDVVPNRQETGFLSIENAPVYRDMAYVYQQCENLAAQLHAIDFAQPKPLIVNRPPPIGLDPYKWGGKL